ncbi:MAG: hypothetical protein JSV49_09650 [Thermoplasmata archaeon]|nr:MAG: hypothetical protein JSV49_09650 [Thermoplasmata archaeon]
MKGNIVFMEFRTGWKGILVFSIIIILSAGGFPSMYPTIKESGLEDLKGIEFLTIDVPEEKGGMINLSSVAVPGAVSYNVVEDNTSTFQDTLSESLRNFSTEETAISIAYDFDEKRY